MSVGVVAAGMVTALGLDWETSCAAARAGIRRTSELDHFQFQTAEIGAPQFATGCQIDLLTRGFEGFGRLVRLLAGALHDLLGHIGDDSALLNDAAFYLSIPCPLRLLDPGQFEEQQDNDQQSNLLRREIGARLLADSCRFARWPVEARLQILSSAGHAGFAEALQHAMNDLHTHRETRCVVGGVDSLLDEDTLTWLIGTDRLKHRAHAAGLVPGEGCAVLMLSNPTTAREEICIVESVHIGLESLTLLADQPAHGAGLWRTASGVISNGSEDRRESPALISDHNGEVYRARELGGTILHLRKQMGTDDELHISYPTLSFGDTSAASGALATAVAAYSYFRNIECSASTLVLSTSDGPARGAILVRRAPFRRNDV